MNESIAQKIQGAHKVLEVARQVDDVETIELMQDRIRFYEKLLRDVGAGLDDVRAGRVRPWWQVKREMDEAKAHPCGFACLLSDGHRGGHRMPVVEASGAWSES